MQRMIQEQHPAKLVLIIYRRTLARDIMQNFTSLGFKYYVGSCDDPQVWESLLVLDFFHRQTIDSCVQKRLCSIRRSLDLRYELLAQYESESLLCHTDENTIAHKDIGMWSFFDKLLKQCSTIIRCMVMCQTEVCTWLFLTDRLLLLRTIIMRRNNTLNIVCDPTIWATDLHNTMHRKLEFTTSDEHRRRMTASSALTFKAADRTVQWDDEDRVC